MEIKFETLKKLFATFLLSFFLCSTMYMGLEASKNNDLIKLKQYDNYINSINRDSMIQSIEKYIEIKNKANLAYNAVDKHIKTIAPKSKVSGKVIVETCIKYDIDIRLALAQAEAESHFGTTGIARKTNSIYNVNSCDGWSAEYIKRKGLGYKTPNHSIEPWAKLIKSKYLVNGKTEKQLIRNFVTKSGSRYASSKQYEANMQRIYYSIPNDIVKKYNEYKYHSTL